MSGFVVQMVDAYTRAVLEETEEIFPAREEAEDFARECTRAFVNIGPIRSPAGRSYNPGKDVTFVVAEKIN